MTRNTQVEQIASAVHSEAGHSILAYFPESAFAAPALRRIFEVFRRLFVVIPAASPWSSYRSEFLRENVGIQFLSLRHLLLLQSFDFVCLKINALHRSYNWSCFMAALGADLSGQRRTIRVFQCPCGHTEAVSLQL
jgi:hypothetical protein